jgi:hypothetical protein
MSTSSPKVHSVTWMLSLLAVLLLYVLTWPPIEIKCSTITHTGPESVRFIISKPGWVDILYRPLHTLMDENLFRPPHALIDVNDGHNPVASYWEWWLSRLL